MTANLNVRDYDGDHYYMWDAQEQYWKGHEWWSANKDQSVLNYQSNGNYARSNADSRYYHEGGASGRFDATQSCTTLPNANELSWYYLGLYGYYWSSSARPGYSYDARMLGLSSGSAYVYFGNRYYGYRAEKFTDFGDN